MRFVKDLKGGSLSKTFVYSEGSQLYVRKCISSSADREYGLTRWQSQIRKLQILKRFMPENTPGITRMGVEGSEYFYDIPYFQSAQDCYQGIMNDLEPESLAESVVELLRILQSTKLADTVGSLALYVAEEMLSPLQVALVTLEKGLLPVTANEASVLREIIREGIAKTKNLLAEVGHISLRQSLTHGNLTLENILWDSASKKLIMIDPYAETYCESILGDISQIMQTSKGGYEYIMSSVDAELSGLFDYGSISLPSQLQCFTHRFQELLDSEEWYSREYASLLLASQFMRMFPFKLKLNPRQGILFLVHGLRLL